VLVLGPLAVVVLILLVCVILCKSQPPVPTAVPAVPVEVLTISPIPKLEETFDLPGVVEPNRVVRVAAEVDSRVERIEGQEGLPCKQGQVIIALNTDLLAAAYHQVKATAEFDARELDRVSDLRSRDVATSSELDQARARANASQAAMERAKAELDRATIVAPIDGIINRIPVEVGEYVQKGAEVAELVEIDTVKVAVDVPSRDVAYLKVGAEEKVFLDPQGQPLVGRITYVSEVAAASTRTSRVEVSVDNRGRVLRSGQIVGVRLKRRELTDAILIPLESVIPLEDGKEVYVVEGDKAVRRVVTLGIMKGSSVQVTEGLAAGDQLIVGGGQRYVGPGQAVRVVGPARQPATARPVAVPGGNAVTSPAGSEARP
jgi:membrane fusion protein (multidrug efflux system)